MFDVLSKIFSLAGDKSQKIATRFILILFFGLILILADSYFDLSFNWRINNKLTQLERIQKLSPDKFAADSVLQADIQIIKNEILDRKGFKERLQNIFSADNGKKSKKNFVWPKLSSRFITSCFFFWLAMLFMPLWFFSDKNKTDFSEQFVKFIFAEMVLLIASLFFSWILSFIPTFKFILFNHIINLVAGLWISSFFIHMYDE